MTLRTKDVLIFFWHFYNLPNAVITIFYVDKISYHFDKSWVSVFLDVVDVAKVTAGSICYINICYIDILNIFSDTTHTVSQVKHSASPDDNFLCGRINQCALLPGNFLEKGVLKISQNSQENSFPFCQCRTSWRSVTDSRWTS